LFWRWASSLGVLGVVRKCSGAQIMTRSVKGCLDLFALVDWMCRMCMEWGVWWRFTARSVPRSIRWLRLGERHERETQDGCPSALIHPCPEPYRHHCKPLIS
jgi:hypothetical protein